MSAGLPVAKPYLRLPDFKQLPQDLSKFKKELEDYLDHMNRVWEERDRQLAGSAHLNFESANIMEWSDGLPMNDGIRDATDMFRRALADTNFSTFYIPDGAYLLDQVTVSRRTKWVASPNAILYMRSAVAGDNAVFRFDAGSNGSSWTGGIFDGRRSDLAASYTAGANHHWVGIRVAGGASEMTVTNVRFQNFVRWGFYVGSGDSLTFDDIEVVNCGNAFLWQNTDNSRLHNIRCSDISNETIQTFQHACEIRDLTANSISHIVIHDYHPDNSAVASESTPTCFELERITDCVIDHLYAYDYTGDPTSRNYRGLEIAYAERCSFNKVLISSYQIGADLETVVDSTIDGLLIDGEYVGAAASAPIGLRIKSAGQYVQVAGGASRANAGCRNLTLSNSQVQRVAGDGILVQSGDMSFQSVGVVGCDDNGFHFDEAVTNASFFPGHPEQRISHVTMAACTAWCNGLAGLKVDQGAEISGSDNDFTNNGQDTGGGVNNRSGIYLVGGSEIAFSGLTISDDQSWTKTLGLSFNPGSTTNDLYTVTLFDPDQVNVGQRITLTNALGPGDTSGRVVAKDRDEVTLDFGAPTTLSSTGNTVAMTGTWTSTGTTVNGDAGGAVEAANTELVGRCWIESGGQVRQVIKVNGASQFITNTAFAPALAGATINRIRVNAVGIPSQRLGVRMDSGFGGPLVLDCTNSVGNTVTPVSNGGTARWDITLGPGDHDVAESIALDGANGSQLAGRGQLATRLLATSTSLNVITVDGASTIRGFAIRNLFIALKTGTGVSGAAIRMVDAQNGILENIRIAKAGVYGEIWNGIYGEELYQVSLEDVYVEDTAEDGVVLVDTLDIHLRNVQALSCAGDGIVFDTCAGPDASGCQAHGCSGDGIVIRKTVGVPVFDGSVFHQYFGTQGDDNVGHNWLITNLTDGRFIGCWAGAGTGTDKDGYHIEGTVLGTDGGRNLTFQGCRAQSSRRHGFYLENSTQIRIGGCHIKSNDQQGTVGGAAGVYVENCTDLTINDNDFRSFNAAQDYAVWLTGSSTDNVIIESNICTEQVVQPFNVVAPLIPIAKDILFNNNLPKSLVRVNGRETHYNVAGDGTTDDQPVLQQVIDDVSTLADGGMIELESGHTYVCDTVLAIDASGIHLRGMSNTPTTLDFSSQGVDGDGIYVNLSSGSTQSDIHIAHLRLLGGNGTATDVGTAIYVNDLTNCVFEDLTIESWSYGINNNALTAIEECLFFANEFIDVTQVTLLAQMTNCRIQSNLEVAPAASIAMSEIAGSDTNVWSGNIFAGNPVISGTNSIISADGNVGVNTYLTNSNNSAGLAITAGIVYARKTRTVNSNLNFDSILVGTALPYQGRRLTLHLSTVGGGAATSITVRDRAASGVGTGGFDLDLTAAVPLVVTTGQEWIVELRVNYDQTAWVEVSRTQII